MSLRRHLSVPVRRWLALWLVLGAACALPGQQAVRQPNVIVILADDLGAADLGATGVRDLVTPHLDSLARNGVSLTNAYITSPVCLPSRMGLVTGRQQERFGVQTLAGPTHVGKVGLPPDEVTLGDRLRAAGYRTAIVGKWHMGERSPHLPNERGFDEFVGFLGGGMPYLPDKPGVVWRDGNPVEKSEYLTDMFGREAAEFVGRNHDRPFFLYLCFNAPHTPLEATDRHLQRHAHIEEPGRRYYAAMVSAMDDNVGRVLDALRCHGLENDTLIFFLSDNGGAPQNWSDNDPLRSGKYELYEGGIRTPFFVQWKAGGIRAGTTKAALASALDIVPTALAAAGIEAGASPDLDGENLLPLLRGEVADVKRERLFWRYGPFMSALREGPWKLVRVGVGAETDPAWELYDLASDPGETHNLASRRPEVVAALSSRYGAWQAALPPPHFLDQRLLDGVIWWRKRDLPEN